MAGNWLASGKQMTQGTHNTQVQTNVYWAIAMVVAPARLSSMLEEDCDWEPLQADLDSALASCPDCPWQVSLADGWLHENESGLCADALLGGEHGDERFVLRVRIRNIEPELLLNLHRVGAETTPFRFTRGDWEFVLETDTNSYGW